jgi:hypothetical protein
VGQRVNDGVQSGTLAGQERDIQQLEASMKRLESADVLLAISEDGDLRIVHTDADARKAAGDGFTIYTPRDAYIYVTLTEHERRMLHSFKKRFGGTTEWKVKP